ncbi:MAG: metallophosphoesterase, partial [Meiothermus sp.]
EDGVALSFLELWRRARGQPHDLERLTAEHVAWLRQRPALALVGDTLLMHADSDFYLEYGSGLEEINARIGGILESENTEV